jgi:hypothetical protein
MGLEGLLQEQLYLKQDIVGTGFSYLSVGTFDLEGT